MATRPFRPRSSSFPALLRITGPYMHGLILGSVALFLILINLFFPRFVTGLRMGLTDIGAPLIDMVAAPGRVFAAMGENWHVWTQTREENEKLKAELNALKTWRLASEQQAEELKYLRGLLKYKDETVMATLTSRVIVQAGGNFSNSIVVTAGARDGVRKDMIAMDQDGVAGRVIEVGGWSSRVLLMQDLNFRLPVVLENGTRAILAGEGEELPRLRYIAREAEVKPGMRVVTSGHGGIFPPRLPVGVVREVKGEDVRITPYAHFDDLQILRLVVYDLQGKGEGATQK